MLAALFNGLMVLSVSQPDLKQAAVSRVMQRMMRVLLEA